MAPVFPTTIAIVGDAFPRMTGTAIGFVITCGWIGLAVSSRIIGAIAGRRPTATEEGSARDPSVGGTDGRLGPRDPERPALENCVTHHRVTETQTRLNDINLKPISL